MTLSDLEFFVIVGALLYIASAVSTIKQYVKALWHLTYNESEEDDG